MDIARTSSLTSSEKVSRLRLIRTDSIGPITFKHLIDKFGSANAAIAAIPELAARGGRKKPLRVPPKSAIEGELAAVDRFGASALFLGDHDYPAPLAAIDDAPPILFTKGHLHLLDKDKIGIVGARNASAPGITVTKRITTDLSASGVVIVSGLARGIDTTSHWASLKGGTIACVAGGLDVIYPRENTELYDHICAEGLLVSEMPLSTKPQARHFPRRNRLISGLSLGTLVIEATEKSGSLITARMALEQGREVFAVPGSPLDPRSAGTNRLIKDGAVLTASAEDILQELPALRRMSFADPTELPLFRAAAQSSEPSEKARTLILTLLGPTPTHIDDIIRLSDIDASDVLTIILELEIAGLAVRYPGGRVSLDYEN
ncbi:DNA processing protein DprA [Kordiimonas sediminis]|uniref:DNA processing protein DprA n=1 Tax=Kordiimonas sediminis TaxID=1735581 RepID=A0A919AVQ1_9PROT|nr:DNA-processing protein DprA [Kordiimonas sediminis]GHF25768.1 DNA processing protein DprA [Kordiimonas sediminis]